MYDLFIVGATSEKKFAGTYESSRRNFGDSEITLEVIYRRERTSSEIFT